MEAGTPAARWGSCGLHAAFKRLLRAPRLLTASAESSVGSCSKAELIEPGASVTVWWETWRHRRLRGSSGNARTANGRRVPKLRRPRPTAGLGQTDAALRRGGRGSRSVAGNGSTRPGARACVVLGPRLPGAARSSSGLAAFSRAGEIPPRAPRLAKVWGPRGIPAAVQVSAVPRCSRTPESYGRLTGIARHLT